MRVNQESYEREKEAYKYPVKKEAHPSSLSTEQVKEMASPHPLSDSRSDSEDQGTSKNGRGSLSLSSPLELRRVGAQGQRESKESTGERRETEREMGRVFKTTRVKIRAEDFKSTVQLIR